MTQRALWYLRRKQRRKAEDENPPCLISSDRVRSPDSGSISYTNNSDEISPGRMSSSERASGFLTDCQYADSTSPLPRELPSPTVYPRTTPLTQRALRYSRREQRREVAEGNSPRWKNPNCVGSPSPGSISYTHRFQIFPAQMTLSQRASQPPTDCNDLYSFNYTHLPRKPLSQTVHPRATEVTRRTLRYLRRTQRREIEEKKVFRLIDSKLAPPPSGPIPHTNPFTDTKNSPATTQTFEHVLKRETVLQHNTVCHARFLVRHSPPPCEPLSPVAHPRAPLRRTTMSLPSSSTKTTAATTRLPTSAPAGQGSSAAPARFSAPTSPVGTLALRVVAGSGPEPSHGHQSSPPTHMQPLAHLWPQMSHDMRLELTKISMADLRAGLDHAESTAKNDAEATATRHATELAEEEYEREQSLLLAEVRHTADSLAAARATLKAKQADTEGSAIIVGSRTHAHDKAKAAARLSSRKHEDELSRFSCQATPPTSAHPTMPPPPPRSSPTAAAWTERRT